MRVGERDGGVEIEALEQAVAGDVGVDDGGDAGILEALGDIERGQLGGLRPAFDRDLAVARIEADRDAAGKLLARASFTSSGSRTAAVPMMTRATPLPSQASTVARSRMPPPSCTGIVTALQDAPRPRRVHRLAGEGAVEIDDVQIFEALRCEGSRLRGGIAVEHGRARHVALLQAHALAVLEIDGGEQDHGFHFKKFAISARPRRWLFSGWNCVPTWCRGRRSR